MVKRTLVNFGTDMTNWKIGPLMYWTAKEIKSGLVKRLVEVIYL
jgi:hypothetical protein